MLGRPNEEWERGRSERRIPERKADKGIKVVSIEGTIRWSWKKIELRERNFIRSKIRKPLILLKEKALNKDQIKGIKTNNKGKI